MFIYKREFAFDLETLSTNLKRNKNFYEVIRQLCFSQSNLRKIKEEKTVAEHGNVLDLTLGPQIVDDCAHFFLSQSKIFKRNEVGI